MIPLIVIEGPTASGKTNLAVQLASELGSQIISADSRQIYRNMDIGTAKPSEAELQSVPHHLIGIINPDESYNAGRFSSDAVRILERLNSKGIIPIVCGGTGLYVSALLNGIFELESVDPQIREKLIQRLQNEDLSVLYHELEMVDPQFAHKISPKDKQRILRGLEVFLATGMPISQHWQVQRPQQRFEVLRILLDPPREQLYARINQRIADMLHQGLLDELSELFEMGYTESSPGLSSLGYREFIAYINGSAALDDCASLAAKNSRNYAKRQCTWYRKHIFDLTLRCDDLIISDVIRQITARYT